MKTGSTAYAKYAVIALTADKIQIERNVKSNHTDRYNKKTMMTFSIRHAFQLQQIPENLYLIPVH